MGKNQIYSAFSRKMQQAEELQRGVNFSHISASFSPLRFQIVDSDPLEVMKHHPDKHHAVYIVQEAK